MAEYEGNAAADALLAAITDEPLPEGAHDDAEFMAEHRSATADVALLREQLRIMGDTLATEGEGDTESGRDKVPEWSAAPVPLRPPKPRRARRYAGVAVGALVAAVGTAMLGGLVWLGVQGGAGDSAGSESSAAQEDSGGRLTASREIRLACSKVLVEGTVQSITPTDDGNVRVVLKVKRYYRPERSVADHPTIGVTLLGSARQDLKVGTYTLVRVPVFPEDGQDWETGWGVGDARKDILDALPGARGMECAAPHEGGDSRRR